MSASGSATTFYAGDAVAIGADFVAGELACSSRGGPRALAAVRFPDHTLCEYLDALSAVLGAPPLSNSLGATVGAIEGDIGWACAVAPEWVRAVAVVDIGAATELVGAWSARLGGGSVAPDLAGAVGDLVRLCQVADREGVQVVYSWCL